MLQLVCTWDQMWSGKVHSADRLYSLTKKAGLYVLFCQSCGWYFVSDKPVFSHELGCIWIWQYPNAKSSVKKTFIFPADPVNLVEESMGFSNRIENFIVYWTVCSRPRDCLSQGKLKDEIAPAFCIILSYSKWNIP